jgi:2-hydroxyglutarate dehydrogenase
VDRDRIAEIEPHVRALDGLHSPETGIVDYGRVAAAYADDVEAAGGTITTGCGVTGVRVAAGWLRLTHTSGETLARHALFCAGGWSDRLATMAGGSANPRIVPFRGAYMRLRPERRALVRGMVYPVPDPELPFLGVHLTRRIDGEVLIGPSALLAGARDAYSLLRVRPADVASTLTWPGTYRMARRFWRTGIDEARHLLPGGTFVAAAAEFVPELRQSDVLPGFAGVRAQAVDRAGRLVDDFVFSHTDRALHVRNAPSPAATSSLAIARHIADEAQRAFDLPRTS